MTVNELIEELRKQPAGATIKISRVDGPPLTARKVRPSSCGSVVYIDDHEDYQELLKEMVRASCGL